MNKAYALVHITDIAYGIDRLYTYSVPNKLREDIRVGSVVVVPFGNANKRVSAVVVEFSDHCNYPHIKSVESIMQYPFDVPSDLISTCTFMKERFFCTFGNAFRAVIPPGVNLGTETVYTAEKDRDISNLNDAGQVMMRFIMRSGCITEREAVDEYGEECKILLNALCKSNYIVKSSRVPEKLNEKNLFTYSLTVSAEEANELAESGEGLTEKQKGLISLLIHYPAATMREIEEIGGYSASIVNALLKKGLLEKRETSFFRDAYSFENIEPEKPFTLSDEQKNAVDGLCELASSNKASGALLFGVTGSGKTRVITEVAKSVIKSGRQVIILLPEIGLA